MSRTGEQHNGYTIQVHYIIGDSVNVDRFECSEFECDRRAGVLRLINGADAEGPVYMAQYEKIWRVLTRPRTS